MTAPHAPVMTPGDLLLHSNKGLVSDLIRIVGGSDYSHTSLVLNATHVAEANAHGIGTHPLQPALQAGYFTDTYRLVTSPATLRPVLERAEHYLKIGGRYAFEQLPLLAVLCIIRKIPLPPVAGRYLRNLLDAAASTLSRIIAAGKEPMICTEFVYRCFDEARPDDVDEYSIIIDPYPPNILLTTTLAATVPRCGHQGIHKDSLLAAVAKRIPRAGSVPPPVTGAPSEKFDEMLAKRYRDEVKSGPKSGWLTPDDFATDSELVARLDRLVALWLRAVRCKAATGMAPSARLAWSYSAFSRTIADFVTERDFISSNSLRNVGRTTPQVAAKRAGTGSRTLG